MCARRRIDASLLPEAPPPLADLTVYAWQVVCVARAQLERDGVAGLSLNAIAAELGVTTPSLYRHVTGKHMLESQLMAWGLWELGDATVAGAAREADTLWGVVTAVRAWALANPQLYELTSSRSLDEPLLRAAEANTYVTLTDELAPPAARRLVWPFIHGLAMLEIKGRFPRGYDVDALWRTGIDQLRTVTELHT